jgi:hypothetical protein
MVNIKKNKTKKGKHFSLCVLLNLVFIFLYLDAVGATTFSVTGTTGLNSGAYAAVDFAYVPNDFCTVNGETISFFTGTSTTVATTNVSSEGEKDRKKRN